MGLSAHTPWKWKASRAGLYSEDGTSGLITSPAPVCPSESEFLTGNSECASLAADLQIQQLNPIKVLSVQPQPLPIPTHGAKLLRIQEVHCTEVNDRCTEKAKNSLTLGLLTFLQRWFCLWVQLTYMCRLQNL